MKLISTPITRRQFVEGMALGSVALSLGFTHRAHAANAHHHAAAQADLVIGKTSVNITGKNRHAITVNGGLPAPILRFKEGDELLLRVHNTLREDTSIHWHGLLVPADMDGVPGFSFAGIRTQETFTYRFPLKQSGTYWYHSHSAMQEAMGLYGAIIIEPKEPAPYHYDREHIVLLSDWSDSHPATILENLRKQGDYYNYQQQTVGDFWRNVKAQGFASTWAERRAWAKMRMTPTDLADVSAATYTYLINGQSPANHWTGIFKQGEKIRLRFINASAMSYFDIRIPGLRMMVVAADGQEIEPVSVDEFRLAVAETLDVIVEPTENAHTIFAQSMDRSGYARATLATAEGLQAMVPALDTRSLLTMDDMGHGDHQAHQHAASPHGNHMPSAVQHPASEKNNPGVDMQTLMPLPKLDDPGIGLRDLARNQHKKVLTYADLKSRFADPDGREPSRSIELHLTGHMGRYVWSFDGIPFEKADPIRLQYGERVRVVLVNDTMMEHPIHLHGMWSDLENEHQQFQVRKHTITMPPGTRRSFRVTADALGRWAFHCHLLMHMDTGMFREVRVEV